MKMIARIVGAGVLMAALAGCAATPLATQAEAQDAAPLYSGTFAGDYQSLSACVTLAWNREPVGQFRQVFDQPNRTAFIEGAYRVFAFMHPVHATLRQVDDRTVAVQFRQTPDSKEAPDWVWRAVEDCAHRES